MSEVKIPPALQLTSPEALANYHAAAKALIHEIDHPILLSPTDPQFAELLRRREAQLSTACKTLLMAVGTFLENARCVACKHPISVDGICYSCGHIKAVETALGALKQIAENEHSAPTPKQMAQEAIKVVQVHGAANKALVANAFKRAKGQAPPPQPSNGNEPSRIIRPF